MSWRPEDRRQSYGADYRRKRAACLRRANWRCEIRIPGVCIRVASQADHALGIAADPHHDHLRAACDPCHKHVTARQGRKTGGRSSDPPAKPRTAW
jgi:5-methylcytosine-specific restriction endonuclease McrA